MVKKYRKKPVIVEAVQYHYNSRSDNNYNEVAGFLNNQEERNISGIRDDGCLTIHTLEGNMIASSNDWIIKGVRGEFYPCKPDVFGQTYEEVNGG